MKKVTNGNLNSKLNPDIFRLPEKPTKSFDRGGGFEKSYISKKEIKINNTSEVKMKINKKDTCLKSGLIIKKWWLRLYKQKNINKISK